MGTIFYFFIPPWVSHASPCTVIKWFCCVIFWKSPYKILKNHYKNKPFTTSWKKLSWRFMNFVKRGLRYSKIFTYFNSHVMPLLVLPAGDVIIFKVHLFPSYSIFFGLRLFCWLKQPPFRKFLFVCKKTTEKKKKKNEIYRCYFCIII